MEDPRRRRLIEALALGLFSCTVRGAYAQAASGAPGRLPPGRSIYRMTGTVLVNGRPATSDTVIAPGDTVETGRDSELIFVVGGHSMIVRAESRLAIEADTRQSSSLLIAGLRLLTGKLLSVSRDTHTRVTTATATIGIRGTGWYAESDPERTYFCTCYGSTEIVARNDPTSIERIESTHHDRPLYILAKSEPGNAIRSAPWMNHSDQELVLIETLVGRTPPFGASYNYVPAPAPPATPPRNY